MDRRGHKKGCFKCGRLDHLKVDCPRVRRENERALQAVWGGSEDDDDSSDGEIIAAQAHMAIAETDRGISEVTTNPDTLENTSSDTDSYSNNDENLAIIIKDIQLEIEKVQDKYASIKAQSMVESQEKTQLKIELEKTKNQLKNVTSNLGNVLYQNRVFRNEMRRWPYYRNSG
ncbi:hypothetical protein LINGRAHAP2_LOCUS4884, partial [Linum grandiflorum]